MSSIIIKTTNSGSNKNNLSSNLRYLIQKAGIDIAELSKSTGIALTTLNGLKRGAGNPTLSTLQTISEFFQISIGQLTETNISSESSRKTNLMEVPLLEIPELPEFFVSPNKFNVKIAIEVERNNSIFFAVKVSNSSMSPHFEKGTIFIISPEFQPQDGDIALVQFNNHLPCFRKIFIEGDTFIFTSVVEMLGNEISKSSDYQILGVVSKAIQNFHE
jgi:transcriptional regulator with XRE-family HTH domain